VDHAGAIDRRGEPLDPVAPVDQQWSPLPPAGTCARDPGVLLVMADGDGRAAGAANDDRGATQ
jgi:hypothetical protein